MKEQKGVPLYTEDVIRFDQPRAATTAQHGVSSTPNRSRTPPASIPRAGHSINHHPEDTPYLTNDFISQSAHHQRQQRLRAPVFADADYGEDEPKPRSYTTTRRLDHNPLETRKLPARRFDAGRLLVVVGIALLIMLLGWLALSWLGNWWQTQTNDWTYGRPRTFQIDAVVGHHDDASHPSHFIAMNLNRHVLVIEMPGDNPSKALIYTGPTLVGDGQDLTPVTLTFVDVNGDGKPDMEIHILDQVIVFLNNGSKFVAP
jgi:hypothetical protein